MQFNARARARAWSLRRGDRPAWFLPRRKFRRGEIRQSQATRCPFYVRPPAQPERNGNLSISRVSRFTFRPNRLHSFPEWRERGIFVRSAAKRMTLTRIPERAVPVLPGAGYRARNGNSRQIVCSCGIARKRARYRGRARACTFTRQEAHPLWLTGIKACEGNLHSAVETSLARKSISIKR